MKRLLAIGMLISTPAFAADSVTMTWTDSTGTYSVIYNIENPTLTDVKTAYINRFNINPVQPPQTKTMTEPEFYDKLTQQLVTDVLNYSQQYKQQQAIQAIPPIVITSGAGGTTQSTPQSAPTTPAKTTPPANQLPPSIKK